MLIDATEAVRRLGVARPTLYAYVSRGLVRAEPDPGDPRRSLYRAEDVAQLVARKARGRKPDSVARSTLDWGVPVLDSAITLIRDGRLWYRGRDAVVLSGQASLETVAALLWECGDTDPFAAPIEMPVSWSVPDGVSPLTRALVLLPLAGATDDAAGLIRLLAASLAGVTPDAKPVHRVLADAWGLDRPDGDLLRRAVVLSADHELNASTFVVRGAASTGASLMACLVAGLAALSGPAHGGATRRVAALFDDPAHTDGDDNPGLGHPLYPEGDPRGAALLAALPADDPHRRFAARAVSAGGQAPNLDFGLVATCRHLGLPAGSAFSLFALGRAAGWIAHALEQRQSRRLIRPRARYTGPMPDKRSW